MAPRPTSTGRTSPGTAEPGGEQKGRAVPWSGTARLAEGLAWQRTVGRSRHRGLLRLRYRGPRTLISWPHALPVVRDHFPANGMHNSGYEPAMGSVIRSFRAAGGPARKQNPCPSHANPPNRRRPTDSRRRLPRRPAQSGPRRGYARTGRAGGCPNTPSMPGSSGSRPRDPPGWPGRAVRFGCRGDGSERSPPPGTRPREKSATRFRLSSGQPCGK
jgi:hypothetical protein